MKYIYIIFFIFYTFSCFSTSIQQNDVKIKKKTTYRRNYDVGNELGLDEMIEFDSLGRITMENNYHPYENNDLLNSLSVTYTDRGRIIINCDRRYTDSKSYLYCDTSILPYRTYDTLTLPENVVELSDRYKLKVTNKPNYSDTIFYYNTDKIKQVTYFRNDNKLKIVRRCFQEKGGCLHSMFGVDYDSLYEYYEDNQILKERIFLREDDQETEEEKIQGIIYTYNDKKLLIQKDIYDHETKSYEWKVKIEYEYY